MLNYIFAFLCCIHLYAQEDIPGTRTIELLKKSHFNFRNEKFPDHRIFFYGENHPYKYADSLSIEVFKKLAAENKTKIFCVELGKSVEYIFYYYLKNKTLKTKSGDPYDGFNVFTRRFEKQFLKPLTQFFNEHDSLTLKSYDIETDLDIALDVLYHILTNCDNTAYFYEIRKNFQLIPFNKNKIYAKCRLFIKLFNENRKLFEEKLSSSDFYYVNKITEGMTPGIISDSLEQENEICESYIYREKYMAKNFKELINENPDSRIFVRSGGIHIMSKQEFDNCFPYEKCRNYFPFISELTIGSYLKANCLYDDEHEYINGWFLTKEKRLQIIEEIPSLTNNHFTFFNMDENKKTFDVSFDYLILCY
jgi:hypothetical protein